MPLIMDDDMEVDIDDLFGDGAGLALPSRPPPKELFQRIDELRRSGCCQGIAWSKWGCLATITPNGVGLDFRNLRCHPRDGTWDLSGPANLPQLTPTLDGGPIQHLSWSPNGSDLAAIDATGRVSILTIGTSLNKPHFSRTGQLDATEDLHAIVGAYWLNLLPLHQRPPVIHSLAVKTDQNYRFDMSQGISFGPCHPNPQKSALVCLTTNGVLRLLWPQADAKWYETTSEVESIFSSDDLITHAAICADKNNTLIIAFVTVTKQLHTVRVAIKWGNKPTDKPVNPAQIVVNPSIMIRHSAITNWMDGSSNEGTGPFHVQSSMVALSHLEVFAPSPDGPGGQTTLPTIMTVRSYLPSSPSHYNQDTHSIVDRWELREQPQTLHSAFEQLQPRRDSMVSQPGNNITLMKQEGFSTNKVVLSIHAIALDRILCFAYSDGSFEYRDRVSNSEIFTEGSLDMFSHLSQIGFSYGEEEPCLQVVPSPTNCSVVQLGCDGKLKWKTLGYHMGATGTSLEDPQYAAVIAALTMSCSTAVMGSINYDDLLAIAGRYCALPSFGYDWLSGVSRLLKFHVDYSEESHHDTLIRNPSVQLCLSIQNSLGYKGDLQPRSFGAKLAWVSLQIRNCVVLMTMATNMKVPDPEQQKKISGLEDNEAIRILSGSVRWCLDLMAWLIDCLIHPEDTSTFQPIQSGKPIDLDTLNSRLHASNNVALHILLSSATRGFLTAICRRLSHLDYTARKAMQNATQVQSAESGQSLQPLISTPLRASYTSVETLTSRSIIQIRIFETFLTSISASVKDAYTSAGLASTGAQSQQQPQSKLTEPTRNNVEQIMLFGGALPEALGLAMTHLFSSLLPTLRAGIDPSKLFFHDFSLLALDSTPPSKPRQDQLSSSATASHDQTQSEEKKAADDRVAHTIDIFQRVPVILGQEVEDLQDGVRGREAKRWRRCARCAAVMEDVTSHKPAVQFLIMQQRRCFCGGNWDILTGRQVVA